MVSRKRPRWLFNFSSIMILPKKWQKMIEQNDIGSWFNKLHLKQEKACFTFALKYKKLFPQPNRKYESKIFLVEEI